MRCGSRELATGGCLLVRMPGGSLGTGGISLMVGFGLLGIGDTGDLIASGPDKNRSIQVLEEKLGPLKWRG